jgi:pimeloyl-ACP methyl ester carboxylesterase
LTPLSFPGRHDATVLRGGNKFGGLGLLALAVVSVVALASCSAPAAGRDRKSTTTTTPIPPSTAPVTTSSLPTPQPVPGTTDGGSDAFLGAIERVPVAPVPDGSSTVTMPATGTAAYAALGRVAYRSFGSGPDLLMIMGEDGTMTWWETPLLSSLGHHYRVTVFDLPGTGYSQPGPGRDPTIDSLADETAGLADSLGLVSPAVVGWGLGGDVALALAERHPGLAGSLVLVDTTAGGHLAARPRAAVERRLTSPWATAGSLAVDMFSPDGVGTNSADRVAFLADVSAAVPDTLTESAIAIETVLADSVWISNSLAAGASGIHIPTLVVFGSADALYPPSDGTALASLIPGAQSLPIPGSGYAAIYEQPSIFTTALEQFTA